MDTERPYYDDDETDYPTDDSSGFDFDDTDDEGTEESTTEPNASLIDLVADEKAAEFKQQVYQSLYSKVGEKLDSLKAETRQNAFPTDPE